ncbi:MAG: hypothetical protein JKY81_11490 [Colwellia sp.]|nr:hypothetical protein [Colwellia sp.]
MISKLSFSQILLALALAYFAYAFINSFKGQQETLQEVMCQDKEELWQVM